MTYWIGSQMDIAAAQGAAFSAYIAAVPTAIAPDGSEIANPTTAWADPAQTADGQWAIPAYPGMVAPSGCTEVEAVEFKGDETGV